jgi:hypothetical protein
VLIFEKVGVDEDEKENEGWRRLLLFYQFFIQFIVSLSENMIKFHGFIDFSNVIFIINVNLSSKYDINILDFVFTQ